MFKKKAPIYIETFIICLCENLHHTSPVLSAEKEIKLAIKICACQNNVSN